MSHRSCRSGAQFAPSSTSVPMDTSRTPASPEDVMKACMHAALLLPLFPAVQPGCRHVAAASPWVMHATTEPWAAGSPPQALQGAASQASPG